MDSEEPTPLEQAKAVRDATLGGPDVVLGTRRQLAIGALVGLCIVLLSTLGGMKFDTWLTVALCGFVVGIPSLALEFYMSTIERKKPQTEGDEILASAWNIAFNWVADILGYGGAVVGIVAYVGHLSPWAALGFSLVIPGLFLLYLLLIGGGLLRYGIRERRRKRQERRRNRKVAGKA
jgi:hypothetical protein